MTQPNPISNSLSAINNSVPKIICSGTYLPRFGSSISAGTDLPVQDTVTIKPGEIVRIPHSITVEGVKGIAGHIITRSSTPKNLGVYVIYGLIDPDYKGVIMTQIWNLSEKEVTITAGSYVSQIVFSPYIIPISENITASNRQRGPDGFGSTDTKSEMTDAQE